jgi:hypothetical protein
MMDDSKLIEISYQLIQKDFQLEKESVEVQMNSFERLKTYVTKIVSYLLDKDMNGLLNILYRIDVGEETVKQILATSHPDLLAENLANAIIARERKKAEYKMKYSSSK